MRKKETILINTVTLIITSAVLNTVTEEILPIKKHTRLNLMGLPSNTDYNDLGGGNYFLRFGKIINWHQLFEIGKFLWPELKMIGWAERNWDIIRDILLPYFFDLNTLLQRIGGRKLFFTFR